MSMTVLKMEAARLGYRTDLTKWTVRINLDNNEGMDIAALSEIAIPDTFEIKPVFTAGYLQHLIITFIVRVSASN